MVARTCDWRRWGHDLVVVCVVVVVRVEVLGGILVVLW